MSAQDLSSSVRDGLSSKSSSLPSSRIDLPPLPPPLPPRTVIQQTSNDQQCMRVKSDVSPLIGKLQTALTKSSFESEPLPSSVDQPVPPTGLYFVYGTLMDPTLLAEILDLDVPPRLRPARITGHSLKLWGQYPALVDSEPGGEVCGMAFEVNDQRHANRLAMYETRAYRARPCMVRFTDSPGHEGSSGFSFKYDGNPMDLDDGCFDLQLWLLRMGRIKRDLRP